MIREEHRRRERKKVKVMKKDSYEANRANCHWSNRSCTHTLQHCLNSVSDSPADGKSGNSEYPGICERYSADGSCDRSCETPVSHIGHAIGVERHPYRILAMRYQMRDIRCQLVAAKPQRCISIDIDQV